MASTTIKASTPSVATALMVVVRAVSVHMCPFTRAEAVGRGSAPAVRGGV